jgi:hypothetical protein
MDKNIISIYKKDFDDVSKFLKRNFSSPTHWKEWNLVISKYFKTDFFYYVYIEGKNIRGVCPVHKIKKEHNYRLISGPREYLIPYGGWIFDNITEVIPNFVKLQKNECFEIFSLPLLKDFNVKYSNLRILKNFETALIDLTQSENDLWKMINQKRRNMIRKAMKNDVVVSMVKKDDLKEFYEFYTIANKEYSLKSIPINYFIDLVKNASDINIDIFVAKKDNQSLGYNVIVSDKNYSIYWLGIRSKNSVNNGFFDLLQWESIKKAKARNCSFYDLCYLEKDRLPNIYNFKKDYSQVKYDVLNVIDKSLLYRIINKIQKIL